MGLCTTEELIWGDKYHPWLKQDGRLHNAGPSYKCPTAVDDPEDLRVRPGLGHSVALCCRSSTLYRIH